MLCEPFSTISFDTLVEVSDSNVRCLQGKPLQLPINDLKSSISILFLYQRKTISNKIFINETRELLVKIIGVLLRVASWKDHFFILNHIIR